VSGIDFLARIINKLRTEARLYAIDSSLKICYSRHTPRVAQLPESSPFRPCGGAVLEFFNNTGWAFFVQVDYFRVAAIREECRA
jgi:hypothetical protein